MFSGYFLDMSRLAVGDVVIRDDHPVLGPSWLLFSEPREVVSTTTLDKVTACLEAATMHAETGWSVGFLSYEASPGVNSAIFAKMSEGELLTWFALFDSAPTRFRELRPIYDPVDLDACKSEWDFFRYRQAFDEVKAKLASGESYQVNLTFRERFGLSHSAADFFVSRCGIRPPPYATYIHGGDWQVASFSPELLFERVDDCVRTKPMKGTAIASDTPSAIVEAMRMTEDPKLIAENIMIVDMVRNDLSIVSETGSVHVPALLAVERHRGLLQMTSTIESRYSGPTTKLIGSLFPAASITGAPKIATTRIISELEDSPRGVYCGAIGYMRPKAQRFSVAIRTAFIEGQWGEFGIGSGIVWDSDVESEYVECLSKRELLLQAETQWVLVEAFGAHTLCDSDAVNLHLDRLEKNASQLDVPMRRPEIWKALQNESPASREERIKIRIAVRVDGSFEITRGPSAVSATRLVAVLASRPTASGDPNLRLKTNSRSVLDSHLQEHPWADEVLLFNEQGFVTEFCRGNVLVEMDGKLVTPYPSSGCLEGVSVTRMVNEGSAEYGEIPTSALENSKPIYFINSVTGLLDVELLQTSERSHGQVAGQAI